MRLKSISQQFYVYRYGDMIRKTYQMVTPFLQEEENYYLGSIIKESQKICKQIRKRQAEMSGKKTDLKVIYKELMKMSHKPDVELLQVRTEDWKYFLWSSHLQWPLNGTRGIFIHLLHPKVGVSPSWKYYRWNATHPNHDWASFTELLLWRLPRNIPFSKSPFVACFCQNQKGTTYVVSFRFLISSWAMGETWQKLIYFHLLLGYPRFGVASLEGHITLLDKP